MAEPQVFPECNCHEDEGRLDCSTCGYGPRVFAAARRVVAHLAKNATPYLICFENGPLGMSEAEDEDQAEVLNIICGVLAEFGAEVLLAAGKSFAMSAMREVVPSQAKPPMVVTGG